MNKPTPTSTLHGVSGQSRRPLLLIDRPGKSHPLKTVQVSQARGYFIADEVLLEADGTFSGSSLGRLQAHRAPLNVTQGALLVPEWSQLPPITKELISLVAGTYGLEGGRPAPIFNKEMLSVKPVRSGFEATRVAELHDAQDSGQLTEIFSRPAGRTYDDAKDKVREMRAEMAEIEDVRTYLEAYGYENKHRIRGSWGRGHLREIWAGEGDA